MPTDLGEAVTLRGRRRWAASTAPIGAAAENQGKVCVAVSLLFTFTVCQFISFLLFQLLFFRNSSHKNRVNEKEVKINRNEQIYTFNSVHNCKSRCFIIPTSFNFIFFSLPVKIFFILLANRIPKVTLSAAWDKDLSQLNVMVTSSKSVMGIFLVPWEYTVRSQMFKPTTVSSLAAKQLKQLCPKRKEI